VVKACIALEYPPVNIAPRIDATGRVDGNLVSEWVPKDNPSDPFANRGINFIHFDIDPQNSKPANWSPYSLPQRNTEITLWYVQSSWAMKGPALQLTPIISCRCANLGILGSD
jgi:hypothetical protein